MKVFSPARMKDARLAKDMSQADLAWAMNTREQNVHRWENGLTRPFADTVGTLAHATDKPIDFFYVEDEGDAVADAQQAALSAKAREILVGASPELVQALFGEIEKAKVPARPEVAA